MKTPNPLEAELILKEAESMNPGAWVAHNRVAALCARKIAEKCVDLDPDKAYVLGLLHDIGRRFGNELDMRHITEGYYFMTKLGYLDCARICLSHSFPSPKIEVYTGVNDCTKEDTEMVIAFLKGNEFDDYDRLIQLCDALAFSTGPTFIEKRLVDATIRRGFNNYTIEKWKAFLDLKVYFDKKTSCDLYTVIDAKIR